MSLAAVVFDFDGVLVDSNPIKARGYEAAIEPLLGSGAPKVLSIIRATVRDKRGLDRYAVIREIITRIGEAFPELSLSLSGKYEAICESYGRYCDRGIAAAPDIPGARRALETLHLQIPLFVNSATPDIPLRRAVDARGLAVYFAGVFGSSLSKSENLRRVLSLTGARPDQLLFVGDAPQDHDAAKQVSCRFVGIQNESNSFAADPQLESFPDLGFLPRFVADRQQD